MCFTIPLKIRKISGKQAVLEDGRTVKLDLVPGVRVGRYVLAEANMAVAAVTRREALATRKLIKKSI